MSFGMRKRAKIVVIDMEINGRGWYNVGCKIDLRMIKESVDLEEIIWRM